MMSRQIRIFATIPPEKPSPNSRKKLEFTDKPDTLLKMRISGPIVQIVQKVYLGGQT
jgi:hypothetical protein